MSSGPDSETRTLYVATVEHCREMVAALDVDDTLAIAFRALISTMERRIQRYDSNGWGLAPGRRPLAPVLELVPRREG